MRRAARWAVVAGLTAAMACAPVDTVVRSERGPLVRRFHRASVHEGPFRVSLSARWPRLSVELAGQDVCRDEEVAEYASTQVVRRSVPSVVPAFVTGASAVVATGLVFGASFAVSGAPDTSRIDRAGRYGPSPATVVRGWSFVGLGVAVPALAVGVIGLFQGRDEVRPTRREEVEAVADERCHERPLDGPVALEGPAGPVASGEAVGGLATFEASALGGAVDRISYAQRPAELDAASRDVLAAFAACVRLERDGRPPPEGLDGPALADWVARLEACRALRPEVADELDGAHQALRRRDGAKLDGGIPGGG